MQGQHVPVLYRGSTATLRPISLHCAVLYIALGVAPSRMSVVKDQG